MLQGEIFPEELILNAILIWGGSSTDEIQQA